MFGTGFLTGLMAKLAGLGSAAKIAVATATAALTMTVAGGAAGVLPFEGSHSGPAVTVTTTQPASTTEVTTSPTTLDEPANGDASVTTSGGSTPSVTGAVGAGQLPGSSAPSASTSPVPVPGVTLPDLSGLTQVPTQVLACLGPVVDLAKGLPSVSMDKIATIGPNIVSCVSAIVADLPLPSGMSACVSTIMALVRNITSQLPTGTPDLSSLDVAACIPTGLPGSAGLPSGLPFMGGGFPFGH
ncbi:MAG: hypothetical protein M3011_07815 [Actinomycetota bacterium]|nr:hypothetical protein [Actinomycetota bacterium]